MRARLLKIAAATAIGLAAMMPVACGAIAVPGQDPLHENAASSFRGAAGVNATEFGLPGESARGVGWQLKNINYILKRGLQITAGVSVLMLVWTGVLYLTSYGDDEKVKRAKKGVIWTILGLVTGLGGWAVIDLVNSLTLTTTK